MVAAASVLAATAQDKNFHIYLCIGQSNMEGNAQVEPMDRNNVPERFKNIVDRFGDNPEAMKQAGIAYATDQIIDLLANGVKHIHVYSMNKPDVAAGIQRNLSEILKA